MSDKVEFIGIVKQVSAKSLASLDKSYRVVLETEEVAALEVGAFPADVTVSVHIERNPK
jgi:hypothetical protein